MTRSGNDREDCGDSECSSSRSHKVAKRKRKRASREGSKESTQKVRQHASKSRKKRREEKEKGSRRCEESDTLASSSSPCVTKGGGKTLIREKPLNGLTVAVSTLDIRGSRHTSDLDSYRHVTSECLSAGASVTSQVHKRVYAVICNKSAVSQLTQRVRKALKRNILLIDTRWLRECVERGERVDHDAFLLNEMAEEAVRNRHSCVVSNGVDVDNENTIKGDGYQGIVDNEKEFCIKDCAGWTEPKNLDCCCVCHENGNLNCEWCTSCNVTLARKKNETSSAT
uniref:BRCT domain-containing protein n=1 Tax=Odontella aurita TaxID=265563 RepID=A0A7S4N7H1_9STRA|mmetsp:Transcript_5060/g.14525  ORF Transcript_5060/g.14525 Transcript_5060/m.14525 type:complete len:283 (+) Transcript_5060:114-962(+)